jgi:acetyl-CoA carboxylase carboxyltransferase component
VSEETRSTLKKLQDLLSRTLDSERTKAAAKRHKRGYRTARENLADLIDADSFIEYGQLAVAAQRSRKTYEDLQIDTAADGVITGIATINRENFGPDKSRVAVVIYDYSVLAGTQGFYHHQKLDRIFLMAQDLNLPVVMYTEGGGGRPGDTDVTTMIAGLHIESFYTWAKLSGQVPRIAINNGFCFAGNAVLFGCADITIATQTSWIGMAGPAMIEGGGLGNFKPTEIGPTEVQEKNGVVDIVAEDEAEWLKMKPTRRRSPKNCWVIFKGRSRTGPVATRQNCVESYRRTGAEPIRYIERLKCWRTKIHLSSCDPVTGWV